MDRAHLAADLPAENLQGVGVGVYRSTKHVGVLCRDPSDRKLRFIHLGDHEELHSEDDPSKCALWIEAKLEGEQASVVAAQARHIYRKNGLGGIPYGFSPYAGYFGANGEIRWTAAGNGLTCATFVLAVFDRGGVRLVKGETWPTDRPEDKEFQRERIEHVRTKKKGTQAHLQGMKQDVGQVRFRVMEVAGATAADAYPVDFTTAEKLGKQLSDMLQPPPPAQNPTPRENNP